MINIYLSNHLKGVLKTVIRNDRLTNGDISFNQFNKHLKSSHQPGKKNDDGKSSHQRGFWLPWTFRADKDSTLITCVEIANKATKEKKGEVATEIVNGETGETVDCKMPALSANAKDEDDKQSDNESDDEKFAAI